MVTQAHPITVEQYETSFEGFPGLHDQLLNGRIVMTPQPKPLHQHIGENIERLLDNACAGTDYTVNSDCDISSPGPTLPSHPTSSSFSPRVGWRPSRPE